LIGRIATAAESRVPVEQKNNKTQQQSYNDLLTNVGQPNYLERRKNRASSVIIGCLRLQLKYSNCDERRNCYFEIVGAE